MSDTVSGKLTGIYEKTLSLVATVKPRFVKRLLAVLEIGPDVTEVVASRCATIALERSILLNRDAIAQIRAGRPEMANRTEFKADQFEWMARAIRREFQPKESA